MAATTDTESRVTFDTVVAIMAAMGGGDMETMVRLMAGDMV